MPEETAVETPAVETPSEKVAEKSYTEAEHKVLVEAAVQARFKNAPSKEQIAELKAKAAKADELEAANMSELDKANKRADAAEAAVTKAQAEVKAAELASLRLKVGTEKGVPAPLIDRLQGDDAKALEADADAVLASIPKPGTPGANPATPDEKGEEDPFLKGFNS